jgi:AcrR family transcriptional regulator
VPVQPQYKFGANRPRPDGEPPEKARRLLDAANRIVIDEGYAALSIDSVARAAGVYKNAVRYYFGSKDGLVAALVEQEAPPELDDEMLKAVRELPAGSERVRRHMEAERAICEDPDSMRSFYEIFPHALRDPGLRRFLAELYRYHRETDAKMLALPPGCDDAEVAALASLVVAVTDGLAAQLLIEPGDVDTARVYAAFAKMLDAYLVTLREAAETSGQWREPPR